MSLPQVIRCAGSCGSWISPTTEPCAQTEVGTGMGFTELRMCPECRAKLLRPKIEFKEAPAELLDNGWSKVRAKPGPKIGSRRTR